MRSTRRSPWQAWWFVASLSFGVLITACSATSSAIGGSSATGANPTATVGTGQTMPPTLSNAYCQKIMSPDKANQVFQISGDKSISTIDSSSTICNYNNSSGIPIVAITFMSYQAGGTPFSQLVSNTASFDGGTNIMNQPVNGLGDQAYYLSFTTSSGKSDYLFVLKGGTYFIISVGPDTLINSPSDSVAEQDFQQIAQLVLAQL